MRNWKFEEAELLGSVRNGNRGTLEIEAVSLVQLSSGDRVELLSVREMVHGQRGGYLSLPASTWRLLVEELANVLDFPLG